MMRLADLSISVVVPVYNGGEDFRRCLTALTRCANDWASCQKRETFGAAGDATKADSLAVGVGGATLKEYRLAERSIEIIVVSDGDSDDSWRLAEDFGVGLIRLPESGGPAKARNIGAKAAKGDILFFVDADVEIHADTIGRVVQSFETDSDLTALIGSYDDTPGAPNFLSQYRNLIHHYTHQQADLEVSTFWGACGAVRRRAFEAVGGFDEGYRRPCIEDIELGYRLKYAGYKIHLRRDILVKHLKRWTPVSMLRADIFYRALPWTVLLMQVQRTRPMFHQRFMRELNLNWKGKASVVLVFGLVAAAGAALSLELWELFSGLTSVAVRQNTEHAILQRSGAGIALLCGLGLLSINLPVYRFFQRRHGWLFAAKTVPWHWLYFFYSGLVYAYGTVRYRLRPS